MKWLKRAIPIKPIRKADVVCSCFILILLAPLAVFGQTTRELKPLIDSNTVLMAGDYTVKRNVLVKSGVTLTILEKVNLFLGPDVTIIVAGNLKIQGKEKSFVNISSLDSSKPGNGFQIRDLSSGIISISYTKFKYLKRPLTFNKNWLRAAVNIQNCVFKDLKNQEVSIEFQDVDEIQATKEIPVVFSGNTFANNAGGILITNLASDYLHFEITNNVISRNEYTGKEANGIFSSPLFVNYQQSKSARSPFISNNSVCFNYSSMFYEDTIAFFPVNVAVVGSAETLDLSGNYFGDQSAEELARSFDKIATEGKTPFVYFNNILTEPPENLNGHIYSIMVNGKPMTDDNPYKQWDEGIRFISLTANKPVTPGKNFRIEYHFYRNDTLYVKQLEHSIELIDGGKMIMLELRDRIRSNGNVGYFVIDGLYDLRQFDVPAVSVGKKMFLNQSRELLTKFKDLDQIPHRSTTEDVHKAAVDAITKNLVQKGLNPVDSGYKEFKPHWELEFFSGSSMYFGDLTRTRLRIYPANARPAMGLRQSYRTDDRWKIEFRQDYAVIIGDDNVDSKVGKSRGTGFDRNLHVRTTIVDFGVLLEYDLYKFKSGRFIIPSLFVGGNLFFFKPMAQYEGVYYDLRSIGTEGQTLNGQDFRYAKHSWGIPLGFKVRKDLSDKLDICFSYTYNKLFTDYLDDLSTGDYPDAAALKAANPDLGDIAVKLSNPANKVGQRSDSDNYDGYAYFGLSVVFKLY